MAYWTKVRSYSILAQDEKNRPVGYVDLHAGKKFVKKMRETPWADMHQLAAVIAYTNPKGVVRVLEMLKNDWGLKVHFRPLPGYKIVDGKAVKE